VLELHPDDKARLQDQAPDFVQGMRLEAVHDMQPGSVRVFANDTVVEDLVAHRLAAMARGLQVDEAAWLERSVLTQPATTEVLSAVAPVAEKLAVEKAEPVVESSDAEAEPELVDLKTEKPEEEEEDGDVHS